MLIDSTSLQGKGSKMECLGRCSHDLSRVLLTRQACLDDYPPSSILRLNRWVVVVIVRLGEYVSPRCQCQCVSLSDSESVWKHNDRPPFPSCSTVTDLASAASSSRAEET